MTWNRSEEELRKLLDDLNTWHLNIKLDYKIGNSLPFLDVQLTNNNGILSTCVYHKARYSSTFEAFNYERQYISKSPFLPLTDDEQKYFLMRKQILGQPTPRQTQVAMSAALADIDNDPPDDEKQQPDPCKNKSEEKISNYGEKFFSHFTHEKRFETYKRDMH
ncbi:unnamed protein product [Rotaria magnacalcarata]|uniref:Uncharacterized protein n=1 Tax=Rotaria magnacalcarata TaxID=392030 RepID=A0A815G5E7_9BILA|nr:unnamed protein product [Rotaria magnacalcarata]CAF3987767.1 unnamed protein product [Rotaria magnacalcarata]